MEIGAAREARGANMVKCLRRAALAAALAALGGCGTEQLVCSEAADGGVDGGGYGFFPTAVHNWWRDSSQNGNGVSACPDKVVSIAEVNVPVPGRAGAYGFVAQVESAEGMAYRWMGVGEGGNVIRYMDEWSDFAGNPTKIIYYCPQKLRVPDGADVCEGSNWTETWSELEITVADDALDPASCAEMPVDLSEEVCAPIGDPPSGCAWEKTSYSRTWNVIAVGETRTVPAGTFETVHWRTVETDGVETQVKDWWWARGVGKISEDGADATEELVDRCLASEGCQVPAPTYDELYAEQECSP